MTTATETDIKARRQTVLAAVEQQARQDGIKQKQQTDTFLVCRDRIMAAFGEAGLLDGIHPMNAKMMTSDFAAQMAHKLHHR